MRSWVWLLPCVVWRTVFVRAATQWVRLDGQPRRALRLDAEYVLIYDPEAHAEAQLKKVMQMRTANVPQAPQAPDRI